MKALKELIFNRRHYRTSIWFLTQTYISVPRENAKLGFNELENVADMGYVDGVTQIFMNGLKEMDIYNRPLHCTDIKREIMHVRENNMWVKDTPEQAKIKSAIRRIAFRNIQQISEWNKQHPDSEILDTDDFNRSFQIMKQSLGDTCP